MVDQPRCRLSRAPRGVLLSRVAGEVAPLAASWRVRPDMGVDGRAGRRPGIGGWCSRTPRAVIWESCAVAHVADNRKNPLLFWLVLAVLVTSFALAATLIP
jgi:hypothetical protein